MFHSLKNLKIIIIITIMIIIILMMMMMMMMTIITETLKDFPYVWYEEYLHNSSFYKKDRIQCILICFVFSFQTMLCYPIELLYSRLCVHTLWKDKSKIPWEHQVVCIGKNVQAKLRRSVILFYQYGRRDVMRKRSITKGIPSRNFQVTGANYARKLLSTYLNW